MEVIHKELRNLKALILKTLIVIPINKVGVTIYKPNPLNTNFKLVIVA